MTSCQDLRRKTFANAPHLGKKLQITKKCALRAQNWRLF